MVKWPGGRMSVQDFLHWAGSASAAERARAATALTDVYLAQSLGAEERSAAETAMFFLLDDPSPKVRKALAGKLADSPFAPRAIVSALARDQAEIAGCVVSVSPVLTDADLVDIVADGVSATQRMIAARRPLSPGAAAALAEIGDSAAVLDLLDNSDALIAAVSLRRIAERFGGDALIRSRLLDRSTLPGDLRHALMLQLGEALAGHAFVSSMVGAERLRRITREACQSATLRIAEGVPGEELPALVEHLRAIGSVTPAFLITLLCRGNVDFFAAAVVSLTGISAPRVRAILVDGRQGAIRALLGKAGLPQDGLAVYVDAILLWRDTARRNAGESAGTIPGRLIDRHGEAAAKNRTLSDLLALVERTELTARRERARDHISGLLGRAA